LEKCVSPRPFPANPHHRIILGWRTGGKESCNWGTCPVIEDPIKDRILELAVDRFLPLEALCTNITIKEFSMSVFRTFRIPELTWHTPTNYIIIIIFIPFVGGNYMEGKVQQVLPSFCRLETAYDRTLKWIKIKYYKNPLYCQSIKEVPSQAFGLMQLYFYYYKLFYGIILLLSLAIARLA